MDSKEAFKGFNSKKFSKECNTSTSCNPEAKISLIGIRRRKNGRYAAVITDPFRHKKVWLGTFDTDEEASQAYFSKKSELENEKLACIVGVHKKNNRGKYNSEIRNPISKKRIWLGTFGDVESEKLVMQQQCTNKHTHSEQDGKYDELVDVKQGHENVNCGSEIDVLISNSSYGGTDRRIDSYEIGTAEEGFRVYESKKKQVFLGTVTEASKIFNSCLMANVCGTKSSDECNNTTSCNLKDRRSLIGIRRRKSGRYAAVITDPIRHKEVWLGTFDTVEEASQAYFSKKSEFEKLSQGNKENKPKKNYDQIQPESPVVETLNTASLGRRTKRIDSQVKEPGSSKETSCLNTNVLGTKSSDECNNTTSCNLKARRSLIGIRRRKSGRYAAVITDPIRHKEVWLGTFDTVEEASQAYFSKKSEFEKLSQGNKENKPKKNCDQIRQPESPFVMASFSMANDQTSDTARNSGRDKRIDSQETPPHIIGAHKSKTTGRYTSEITNLGTFGTAEEASHAYQSKKFEFQKLVKAKQQQGTNKRTHSEQDAGEWKLVNVKQGHENLNCKHKSAGGSEINVRISNSSSGGTRQWMDSHEVGAVEGAFHDYHSKKSDSQSSKEVELQSNMRTDSYSGEKQKGQEDEDLWMGQWIQLPGDREVMLSLKLGLPIIDNYGSLLGEFSNLDDTQYLYN